MKKTKDDTILGRLIGLAIIIIVIMVVGLMVWRSRQRHYQPIKQEGNMQFTSSAFKSSKAIPKTFSCRGNNINPPLEINNVPEEAKSLALIMHDPDAPIGDFTHWLVWNIPPDTTEIKQDSVPAGAMQGTNDSNKIGYIGPCPPNGTHRYFFDLYALDTTLNLTETSQHQDLQSAIKGHIIAQTSLMGTFSK